MVVGRLLSYWVSVAFQGRLLLNFEGTGPGGDYYWEAGHTQLIGEMGTLPTIIMVQGTVTYRVLKGPGGGVQGEGVFLGNPKDSVWEDWGSLGNIRETPPLGPPPLTTL